MIGVLPGAGPSDWRELRRDGDIVDYHVGTLPLTLWSAETEAYVTGLAETPPAVYAVLRPRPGAKPFDLLVVTASPFEAQDYCDSGEELVEKLPMPPGVEAWVREFVARHHKPEPFVKRRRNPARVEAGVGGRGDRRIRQLSDVYRAPQDRCGAGSG